MSCTCAPKRVADGDFKIVLRPSAHSTRAVIDTYHREVAKALTDLGVGYGEKFVLMRASTLADGVDQDRLGPFSRDSETSRQAALDNYPRSTSQRWRVLIGIFRVPRTRDQLARDLNLGDSSVDARVWELLRGDFVFDSDERRRTSTGSEATVLKVTAKGREAVIEHDDAGI